MSFPFSLRDGSGPCSLQEEEQLRKDGVNVSFCRIDVAVLQPRNNSFGLHNWEDLLYAGQESFESIERACEATGIGSRTHSAKASSHNSSMYAGPG